MLFISRLRVAWRVLFVLTVASFAYTAPAHAADAPDTVSAKVAPGSKTSKLGDYYAFQAVPGSTTTQSVLVINDRPHAVEAHIEGVDAFTGNATGASYGTPGKAPTRTGKWIVVATPVVTLLSFPKPKTCRVVRTRPPVKRGLARKGDK